MEARKLPSGSWRCQVFSHYEEVIQSDGCIKKKRIYKSFTCSDSSKKGKRTCEQMAAEWAANKESEKSDIDLSFKEAANRYIKMREHTLSPRTISSYRDILDNNLSSLANIKLHGITQDTIQKLVNTLAITLSPKTVHNIHGFISAVMGQYRPEFVLRTSLPKKVRPDLYLPSNDDIRRLIECVEGTELELPVLLAVFGPMRRGEICALRAENINGPIVHVCENMVMNEKKEWIIKTPKSYAGDRYIKYPDFVADKLKNKTGRIISLSPDNITCKFRRFLIKQNLPHFRFHDLRHYSASFLHTLGIPDAYIMQRGGWETDSTLKSVYRHAIQDEEKRMFDIANTHFEMLCNTKCNTKK